MFTIKYTDQDGFERLSAGYDIRVVRNGKQVKSLAWIDCVAGDASSPATATNRRIWGQ